MGGGKATESVEGYSWSRPRELTGLAVAEVAHSLKLEVKGVSLKRSPKEANVTLILKG